MIVIPPSSQHADYFTGLAEKTWDTSYEDKKELWDELISENKTLVITCKLTFEEIGEATFHFHYRYSKKDLYCFIEEDQMGK